MQGSRDVEIEEGEKEKENFYLLDLYLIPTVTSAGPRRSQEPGSPTSFPTGWQWCKHPGHLLLFARYITRELVLKQKHHNLQPHLQGPSTNILEYLINTMISYCSLQPYVAVNLFLVEDFSETALRAGNGSRKLLSRGINES